MNINISRTWFGFGISKHPAVTGLKTWLEDAGTGKTCLPVSLAINNLEMRGYTNCAFTGQHQPSDMSKRKEKCSTVTWGKDLQHSARTCAHGPEPHPHRPEWHQRSPGCRAGRRRFWCRNRWSRDVQEQSLCCGFPCWWLWKRQNREVNITAATWLFCIEQIRNKVTTRPYAA